MSYAGVRKTFLSLILLQCGKQAFPVAPSSLAAADQAACRRIPGSTRGVATIRLVGRVIFDNSEVDTLRRVIAVPAGPSTAIALVS